MFRLSCVLMVVMALGDTLAPASEAAERIAVPGRSLPSGPALARSLRVMSPQSDPADPAVPELPSLDCRRVLPADANQRLHDPLCAGGGPAYPRAPPSSG